MLWYTCSKNYLRSLEMWLKVNLYPIPNVDFFSRRQIVEWQLIYWSFFPRLTRNICFNIPSKIRATELYILAPWDCASRLVVIQQQHKKKKMKLWHFEKSLLSLQAQRQHFSPEDGDMKLKCTASIGDIYWQVNEKSAEGFKSKRHSNTVYNTFVREQDGGPQGEPGM